MSEIIEGIGSQWAELIQNQPEEPSEQGQERAESARVRFVPVSAIVEDQERAGGICAEYERREAEAADIKEEILQGVKNGRQPVSLLLKACECIDLLTGEKGFHSKILKAVQDVYGAAMLDTELPEIREKQLLAEINRLTKARDKYQSEISRKAQELNQIREDKLI